MTAPDRSLAERVAEALRAEIVDAGLDDAIAEFVLAADRVYEEDAISRSERYDDALSALAKALGVEP